MIATTLKANVIGQNGDIIVECLYNGDVILTARNFADTETHASVRLSYTQAGAISTLLQLAEIPSDID